VPVGSLTSSRTWRSGRGVWLAGHPPAVGQCIGVTRKDPTAAGKYRPGDEEALRLIDAHAVDVVLCWK
jgi:hypothetical protein